MSSSGLAISVAANPNTLMCLVSVSISVAANPNPLMCLVSVSRIAGDPVCSAGAISVASKRHLLAGVSRC